MNKWLNYFLIIRTDIYRICSFESLILVIVAYLVSEDIETTLFGLFSCCLSVFYPQMLTPNDTSFELLLCSENAYIYFIGSFCVHTITPLFLSWELSYFCQSKKFAFVAYAASLLGEKCWCLACFPSFIILCKSIIDQI